MADEFIEYKVEVRFMAKDLDDAENFIHSMSGDDWIEHLETTSGLDVEETRKRKGITIERHNPETCDECIVARENNDMDRQGYEN